MLVATQTNKPSNQRIIPDNSLTSLASSSFTSTINGFKKITKDMSNSAELSSCNGLKEIPITNSKDRESVDAGRLTKPMIENFTLFWNSSKYTNSITLLNNNTARAKKSLRFELSYVQGENYCSVYIDGILIASAKETYWKRAKHRCADAAIDILKKRQPVVDKAKKQKKTRQVEETNSAQANQKRECNKPRKKRSRKGKKPNLIVPMNNETLTVTLRQKRKSHDGGSVVTNKKKKTNDDISISIEKPTIDLPVQPMSNSYPKIPEQNVGHQLLKKMGWTGGGLGCLGKEGRIEPVMHAVIRRRQGLGIDMTKTNPIKRNDVVKPYTATKRTVIVKPSTAIKLSNTILKPCLTTTMNDIVKPFRATKSNNIVKLSSATKSNAIKPATKSNGIIKPATATKSNVKPATATKSNVKPATATKTNVKPVAATKSNAIIKPSTRSNTIVKPSSAKKTNDDTSISIEKPTIDRTVQPMSNPYPKILDENVGHQLLKKMGLGRQGKEGRIEPVMHAVKPYAATKRTIIVKPSAATKLSNAIVKPSSATKINNIVKSTATSKLIIDVDMPVAPLMSQSSIKACRSVIDVDMLFESLSTKSVRDGIRSHSLLMSQSDIKTETTASSVTNNPVVQSSTPITNKSVIDVDMLYGDTSGCVLDTFLDVDKQLPCAMNNTESSVTNKPVVESSALITNKSVIDVDMLFQTISTESVRNGDTSGCALDTFLDVDKKMSNTESSVTNKPVVESSTPITNKSVIDVNMLFQPISTESVGNGDTSGCALDTFLDVDKQLPCAMSNTIMDDIDMATMPATASKLATNGVDKPCVTTTRNSVIGVAPFHQLKISEPLVKMLQETRARTLLQITTFLKSSEKELRVSDELPRQSRISLYQLCDAHGLQFQSFGDGKKRSIIIRKPEH